MALTVLGGILTGDAATTFTGQAFQALSPVKKLAAYYLMMGRYDRFSSNWGILEVDSGAPGLGPTVGVLSTKNKHKYARQSNLLENRTGQNNY